MNIQASEKTKSYTGCMDTERMLVRYLQALELARKHQKRQKSTQVS